MRGAVLIVCTAVAALMAGCAQPRPPGTDLRGAVVTDAAPVAVGVAGQPRSVLLGGRGLDPAAVEIGRSDWPAAYRDQYGGEHAAYVEEIYDTQQTPPGYYWNGAGGFTWHNFRSYRAGSFSR